MRTVSSYRQIQHAPRKNRSEYECLLFENFRPHVRRIIKVYRGLRARMRFACALACVKHSGRERERQRERETARARILLYVNSKVNDLRLCYTPVFGRNDGEILITIKAGYCKF